MNMEQMGSVQEERHHAKNPERGMREGIDQDGGSADQSVVDKKAEVRAKGLLKTEKILADIEKLKMEIANDPNGENVAVKKMVLKAFEAELEAASNDLLDQMEKIEKGLAQ